MRNRSSTVAGDEHPDAGSADRTPRWWSAGSLLRRPTGVDERILTTMPTERGRYTAMGIVVLATALLAMLSMGISVFSVFGTFEWVIIPIVVVWGGFILGLDCYLMSTVIRLWKMLPRVLLAVAFGFMIAEGLLLGLFHTAIEERVHDDRVAAAATLEGNLKRCNPVPGIDAPAPKSGCEQATLVVNVNPQPAALLRQQAEETQRAKVLQPTVDRDAATYAHLEDLARRECDGVAGPGLTGVPGVGYECRRLRNQADTFYADHSIKKNQDELTRLNRDISSFPRRITAAQSRFTTVRDALIESKRKELIAGQKEIGLLERVRALGHLAAEDPHVRNAQWGLRVFLVLVDSLPVLLKYLSGVTPYDRRAAARIETQQRAGRNSDQTELLQNAAQEEAKRQQIRAVAAQQRQHPVGPAAGSAPDLELERAIAARAAQLLRRDAPVERTGR
ncbi:MAG: hypothetical protein QOE23_2247 [Pseudonocardiales bacterium]|nr:hypothetical protein [Pseudonocardiales bacterium]